MKAWVRVPRAPAPGWLEVCPGHAPPTPRVGMRTGGESPWASRAFMAEWHLPQLRPRTLGP